MNKYTRPDPLQEIFERQGGVIGADLKCVKGEWILDGEAILDGDAGLRLCVLAPTARHGELQCRDDVSTGPRHSSLRRRRLRTSGSTPAGTPIRVPGDRAGRASRRVASDVHQQLLGRQERGRGLGRRLRRQWQAEISARHLGSRPKKNDDKGNFDPVFTVVDWVVASDFADTLADVLPPPAAPPLALEPPKRSEPEPDKGPVPAADTGDDIPF